MYYSGGMKARVSPVQWWQPHSISAPTQDSNPSGFRIMSGDHYTTTAHMCPFVSFLLHIPGQLTFEIYFVWCSFGESIKQMWKSGLKHKQWTVNSHYHEVNSILSVTCGWLVHSPDDINILASRVTRDVMSHLINTHINRVRVDGIRAVIRHGDSDECAELLPSFADLVNRGLF